MCCVCGVILALTYLLLQALLVVVVVLVVVAGMAGGGCRGWGQFAFFSFRMDLFTRTLLSPPLTERLQKFIERYDQLVELGEVPYHYGSHYSNSGSVLHFLVRLQPFTTYGGNHETSISLMAG